MKRGTMKPPNLRFPYFKKETYITYFLFQLRLNEANYLVQKRVKTTLSLGIVTQPSDSSTWEA